MLGDGRVLRMNNTIALVIGILIQIETGGHPDPESAIGDGGAAIGLLQLHKISVREACRIEIRDARLAGREPRSWTPEDRLSREKSIEMAEVILAFHYRRGAVDPEELACRWNRPFSEVPLPYRNKVRALLGRRLL